MSALTGLVANSSVNSCLSPTSLIGLTNSSQSIDGPIKTWTSNICSAAPCSNQTLATVVNTLVNGCQKEITGLSGSDNVDPNTLASEVTPLVQQYYPTVRKVVCLQDNNNNCLVQTLQNIETVTGPLTVNNISNIIQMTMLSGLPSNVTCTNCTKAAYNIINTDVPSIVSDASPAIQSTCGSSFTDGATPSGISVDSNSSSQNNNNGGTTLLASGLSASALAIISAIFTLV
ncbi:hypothetical protein AN958_03717 [Leucoagaricus sp. SymC.cos]|nr:hypothetical protein AN958_03717 [Leucoagaricus sp. SymC.cos]